MHSFRRRLRRRPLGSGSERNWPYFWSVLGGKFVRHPKFQSFTVRVKDPSQPAAKDLPATFEWADECYYLDHLNPGIRPLLVNDPAKIADAEKAVYPGDRFGDALPLAWIQQFDGGREFYTAHIRNGILWAMGGLKRYLLFDSNSAFNSR